MITKNECKNCKNWTKIDGHKKYNNEMGYCDFMNKRVEYTYTKKRISRDVKNKSMVVIHNSEISGDIGELHISSVSEKLIHRHSWVWTDSNFYCIQHERKEAGL